MANFYRLIEPGFSYSSPAYQSLLILAFDHPMFETHYKKVDEKKLTFSNLHHTSPWCSMFVR